MHGMTLGVERRFVAWKNKFTNLFLRICLFVIIVWFAICWVFQCYLGSGIGLGNENPKVRKQGRRLQQWVRDQHEKLEVHPEDIKI